MRDFDKDRAICEAATRGPWKIRKRYFEGTDEVQRVDILHPVNQHVSDVITAMPWSHPLETDAEFIAQAREGWPAAISEIFRLREVVENLEEENAKLKRI